MKATTVRYVYWQDDGWWLGYLEEYPDYTTQGETREDLEAMLRDLYQDLASGEIEKFARVERRQVGELQLRVKRTELIRRIEAIPGVAFGRHGGNHDWYVNTLTGIAQAVPRHNEIHEGTALSIIKKLGAQR